MASAIVMLAAGVSVIGAVVSICWFAVGVAGAPSGYMVFDLDVGTGVCGM